MKRTDTLAKMEGLWEGRCCLAADVYALSCSMMILPIGILDNSSLDDVSLDSWIAWTEDSAPLPPGIEANKCCFNSLHRSN